MQQYLTETYYHNYAHSNIQSFLAKHISESDSTKVQAIKIYEAIRDGWWYDPFKLNFTQTDWQASQMFACKTGHCIDKSNLAVACYRAIGIPARICFAKVKNHIGVEKIIEKIGTDELVPHGFLEIWLNEKWIAITPVFNQELCDKLGVSVLDFDGEGEAVFQSFAEDGGKFMEYLAYYGDFEDLPLGFIVQKFKEHYPEEYVKTYFNNSPLLEIA